MDPKANSITETLDTLIRARYSLIYIESSEETRAIKICRAVAVSQGKALFTWSLTQGIIEVDMSQNNNDIGKVLPDTQEPVTALMKINELGKAAIVVLKDFHRVIDDSMVCRATRDLAAKLRESSTTVIMVSPVMKIPIELQKSITVVDLPLPNIEEIAEVLENILDTTQENAPKSVKKQLIESRKELKNGLREQALNTAKGLTLEEADNVFAKSLIQDKAIVVKTIGAEKEQIIKKTGILEYFNTTINIDDIGGLENLKTWIKKRKKAFSLKAKEFKLRTPRGVFLTGIPGGGKSLAAKAISGYFEMPLLRLDVSKIFSGVVGSSEQNVTQALKTASAVAPCVLWIDEVEKALAGAGSSGNLDSGVTARVFGQLLTWMQEHIDPVFLVVTCNNPLTLPPEFMRRFDEIFFVDLPTLEEREEIFKIHLMKVGRDPAAFKIEYAANNSEGYSGSEIEKAIMSAMYDAFDNGQEVDDTHIHSAIKKLIPLSTQREEEINKMRDWGLKNAINASKKEQAKDPGTKRVLEFQG